MSKSSMYNTGDTVKYKEDSIWKKSVVKLRYLSKIKDKKLIWGYYLEDCNYFGYVSVLEDVLFSTKIVLIEKRSF